MPTSCRHGNVGLGPRAQFGDARGDVRQRRQLPECVEFSGARRLEKRDGMVDDEEEQRDS